MFFKCFQFWSISFIYYIFLIFESKSSLVIWPTDHKLLSEYNLTWRIMHSMVIFSVHYLATIIVVFSINIGKQTHCSQHHRLRVHSRCLLCMIKNKTLKWVNKKNVISKFLRLGHQKAKLFHPQLLRQPQFNQKTNALSCKTKEQLKKCCDKTEDKRQGDGSFRKKYWNISTEDEQVNLQLNKELAW